MVCNKWYAKKLCTCCMSIGKRQILNTKIFFRSGKKVKHIQKNSYQISTHNFVILIIGTSLTVICMGSCNQDSTEKLTTRSEILNFCETVTKFVNKKWRRWIHFLWFFLESIYNVRGDINGVYEPNGYATQAVFRY